MATSKKPADAPAPQGSQPATTPAPDAAQQPDGNQPQQPEGEADAEEQAAQIQQLQAELTAERQINSEQEVKYNAALAVVPLYDDPYTALGEQQFETVLEIVLGEAHNRGIVTTPEEETQAEQEPATTEPAETDPHAETRELLKRNGLKTAYLMPDGSVCFDEKHARHFMGEEFDTLTVISAE